MTDKNSNKLIDRNPPLEGTPDPEKSIIDYLAYLKDQLNFIFTTFGTRITNATKKFISRYADPDQKVWYRSQYDENTDVTTNEDMLRLRSIIQRGAPFSQAELDRYDFNGDGVLRMSDLIKLRNMILANADYYAERVAEIDPSSEKIIRIYDTVFRDVINHLTEITAEGVDVYENDLDGDGNAYNTKMSLRGDALYGYLNGTVVASYPATGLDHLTPQTEDNYETWTDGRLINVPFLTTTDIGAASNSTGDVTTAWLKYICAHYPYKQRCMFTGCVQAASYKMLQVLIYNTSTVDSNGLPQYAMGTFVHYGGDTFIVGVNNYSAYARQVNTSSPAAYVTSQGTTNGWHHRTWSNGWKECWYKRTLTSLSMTSAWGNQYTSGAISRLTYPVSFTAVPHEQVTVAGSSTTSNSSAWLIAYGNTTGNTTTQTGQYQLVRPGQSSGNVTIEYYACGY